MMLPQAIPALLMFGLLALVAVGIGVTVWGGALPRKGDWLVGIPLAYLLGVFGVGWNGLAESHFASTAIAWERGWIWPRDQPGAITIGILQEPLGFCMGALATLLAGLVLLYLVSWPEKDVHKEKLFGAVALATAGVVLAWTALTPWLVLCGIGLSIAGGFLSFGGRWERESDAVVAVRFGGEHSWGLLLGLLGLCLLAGPREALLLGPGSGWTTPESANALADWVGLSLLLAGMLVQLQPFLFFGSLVAESAQPVPIRLLVGQIFPAWGAFALLLRLEPHLRDAGPFFAIDWQVLGWFSLASAALAVAAGLLQESWKAALSLWISAALGVSAAALSFSGPGPAGAILIGASLGGLLIAMAGAALERESNSADGEGGGRRAVWLKIFAGIGAAAGTGFIGFISAGGALDFLLSNADLPLFLAPCLFALFLVTLLAWSSMCRVAQLGSVSRVSWPAITAMAALSLLSLGVLWTGTASGGALLDSQDTVMTSVFDILFGKGGARTSASGAAREAAFFTVSGLHWGALVCGALLAVWTSGRGSGRKGSAWAALSARFPRFVSFLVGGYGIDHAASAVRIFFVGLADAIEHILNDRLWKNWLPGILQFGVRILSDGAAQLDSWISTGLSFVAREGVEGPAKGLQLIQNGDVRWYLLFAVGSGFLILLHFARALG